MRMQPQAVTPAPGHIQGEASSRRPFEEVHLATDSPRGASLRSITSDSSFCRTRVLFALDHEAVKHSLSEFVKGDVHTNGIESLWSMLKRAHQGAFHELSPKHLDRYVQEFASPQDVREFDTIQMMGAIVEN